MTMHLKTAQMCLFMVLMVAGVEMGNKPVAWLGISGIIIELWLIRLEIWFIHRPRLSQWVGNKFFPHLSSNQRRTRV